MKKSRTENTNTNDWQFGFGYRPGRLLRILVPIDIALTPKSNQK